MKTIVLTGEAYKRLPACKEFAEQSFWMRL
jgi:predicted CopG family antitoxin